MTVFKEITLGNLLKETTARHKDHGAILISETSLRMDYSQLLDISYQTAKGFMAMGVKKGDHVCVWTTNIPEWIYMQFGLSMIGAVLVTVNTNYKSSELEYILKQSDSTTLVLMEEQRHQFL